MKRTHVLAALASGPAIAVASIATADTQTYNGAGFPIPDDAPGASSMITANLNTGDGITDVSLELDLTHTWAGDLTVTLQGPGGTMDIMVRPGVPDVSGFGYSTDLGGVYGFADGGADWWADLAANDGGALAGGGTYAPSGASSGAGPAASSFGGTFNGAGALGDWTITVSDSGFGDAGMLNAWSVTITTVSVSSPDEVTPDVIFGSGNANGSFTIDRQASVELGMRGKLCNPPMNIFNSNGDGTYTFNTGSGSASFPQSEWTMEWTVNTDYDDSSGLKVGDLTYEIGMDNDPGAGTDYLVFNPINPGFAIPYTPPSPPSVFWDHAMGDNTTANGAGVSAPDGPTYDTYLDTLNVAQNSWKPTFYQLRYPNSPLDTMASITWDPGVPGRYEYYLKAFDSGVEVAKTAITIIAVDGATMSLEADPCQTDTDPVKAGIQVEVELWLRNPDDDEVTRWVAFLEFDGSLTYEGACSSYGAGPFTGHLQPIDMAEVMPGQLSLDGNTFDTSVGTTDDELLATLVFTIAGVCDATATPAVGFLPAPLFPSTLSFEGVPIGTSLLDSSSIVVDDGDPPVFTLCPTSFSQAADAGLGDGCIGAVVTWADPVATDMCSDVSIVCTPSSGSVFPIGPTVVTCTATDGCGNTSTCMFTVTVKETNIVCVDVELNVAEMPPMSGMGSATRCIHFEFDDNCPMPTTADIELPFDYVSMSDSIGSFVGEIEVPCGVYTSICAKDEQHTQWANANLVVSMDGTKYELDSMTPKLILPAGDTDNDGDVDINDVTWLLAQFGTPALPGGCPWDGMTRDADFNNDGAVGTPDYTLIAPQWLTMSECETCPVPFMASKPEGKPVPPMSIPTTELDRRVAAKADLNLDGMVDHRDVRAFEIREGLPDTLSTSMLLGDLEYRRQQHRKHQR